jgi:hypothetical protein
MGSITLVASIIAGLVATAYLLGYASTGLLGGSIIGGIVAVSFDLYRQLRVGDDSNSRVS